MPVKLEILPTFMLYRQVLRVTTCSPWVRSSFGGVARSQARVTSERSFIFSKLLPDNGVTKIGPLQLDIHVVQNHHVEEQKSHWDKTNKGNYYLKLCLPFVCPVAVRRLLSCMAVLFHLNG